MTTPHEAVSMALCCGECMSNEEQTTAAIEALREGAEERLEAAYTKTEECPRGNWTLFVDAVLGETEEQKDGASE